MADIAELKYDIEPLEKPKRKRLTPEERLAKLQEQVQAAAQRALNRRTATHKAQEEKKAQKKADRNTSKKGLHNQIRAAVLERAQQQGISMSANDVKIPGVAAKMNAVDKYYQAAKKHYYTRTKKPSSIMRLAVEQAQQDGIPVEYLKKTVRNKTVNDLIKQARARMEKNTVKKKKSSMYERFLQFATDLGLSEKEMKSAICVRKKVAK